MRASLFTHIKYEFTNQSQPICCFEVTYLSALSENEACPSILLSKGKSQDPKAGLHLPKKSPWEFRASNTSQFPAAPTCGT